jgi:NAD-dependent deacetylase
MKVLDDFKKRIKQASQLLKKTDNIVAFTGAGISTESGISDFRSPGGVWDRYRIVTYQEFLSSHDARVEYWQMKKELFREMRGSKPNRAHDALAGLERKGKLRCLITQNIDGLHQEAGSSDDMVIELHGTNRKALCLECAKIMPIEDVQVRLEAGETDPRCENCNGLLKPATISFGQAMPEEKMIRAVEYAKSCALFIMIGSSLQVEPAASIPPEAYNAGAKLIFINRTETQWDRLASVVFREDAGEVMGSLMESFDLPMTNNI